MTPTIQIDFQEDDLGRLETLPGTLVVLASAEGKLDRLGRRVDRLAKGALKKALLTDSFALAEQGGLMLEKNASETEARRAGGRIAVAAPDGDLVVAAGSHKRADALSYGLALRAYKFTDRKSDNKEQKSPRKAVFLVSAPEAVSKAAAPMAALTEGVFFARDLTNEPANILSTDEFAARLAAMGELGIEIEILEADELEKLGMNAMLAVGFGSATPTKLVVMRWNAKPGDDTGGISLKPPAGMEAMTGDMGGAGVVSGVMRALALRKSPASVVGIVGLVENMPGPRAQRPGCHVVRAREL